MKLRFILVFMMAVAFGCSQKTNNTAMQVPENFDWQGHRGARGLLPENSIPAFLKALEFPIKTLELDVVISRDSQVVVSHEPWMSASICSKSDGTPVSEEEEKESNIFQLKYAEIQQFDCGSRGNKRFPEQTPLRVSKPLLKEVVQQVEAYCLKQSRELPFYNIEIKSRPEWDGLFTPEPQAFARLVIEQIEESDIKSRICIQSFDVRALQEVRKIDSTIVLALLIENTKGLDNNLKELGFTPDIYSPYYQLVSGNLVKETRERGMLLIPWTVNEITTMQGLINLGVDGIITDYPNLISKMKK